MADKNGPARLVYGLIGFVTVLICAFVTITVIQIKWTKELQKKHAENIQQIQTLRTKCAENLLRDVILSKSGSASEQRKRQGDTLQRMLQEMMAAQEKVLLSHCLNNTGLCIKGQRGQPGLKGDIGVTGVVGQPGTVGQSGPKGDTGTQGSVGDKGDRGLPGNKGSNGAAGPVGPQGPKGHRGQHGLDGPKGRTGLAGAKGEKGEMGDTGLVGPSGARGKQGPPGEKGDIGPVGLKGDLGPPGQQGQPGIDLQKDCKCIRMPVIDTFPSSKQTVQYPIGTHVTLNCDSSSSPKPTITWYLPSDGCGGKSLTVTGKTLDIASLQPSQLGQYRCEATNIYGNTSKTLNIQSNVTGFLDCDFENADMCNWKHTPGDMGYWRIHRGPTSTSGTGPSFDHTKGTSSGYYLYTDTLYNRPNNKVHLLSPHLGATGPTCLSFWYHMYGREEGSLSVETKNNCDRLTTTYETLSGDKGNQWHFAEVQLPAMPTNHTIVFKSVQGGNGVLGDVAIDDIQYYAGSCNTTLYRTGPSVKQITVNVGHKLELDCGIEGYPPPTYQWKKIGGCVIQGNATRSGKRSYIGNTYGNTGSSTYGNTGGGTYGNTGGGTYGNTGGGTYGNHYVVTGGNTGEGTYGGTYGNTGGRNYGNTYGNSGGTYGNHYIVTGGSSYGNTGASSNMDGNNYGRSGGKQVVFHDPGPVSPQDTSQDEAQTITDHAVPAHEGTYTCTASVPGMKPLTTTFNVQVTGHEANYCSFESGMCGWTQDKNDKFDWSLLSGQTDSQETGPKFDHTRQSSTGKYLYIEASSPRSPGHNAVLRSHLMKANQSACFSLYYNMYGVDMGNLTIMIEDNCTHARKVLFTKGGDQGQSWFHHAINISAASVPHDYLVLVSGTVGSSFHSDIAIDDLLFSNGECNYTNDLSTVAECTFEHGLCSWTQAKNDDFDWSRHRGPTQSTSTGPDVDHTLGDRTGYYLYTEASTQTANEKADLLSPMIPGGHSYCLHLATHMYGSAMGKIRIYTREGATEHLIISYSTPDSTRIWRNRTVNLGHHTNSFQVVIEGVVGTSYNSDAAIDDVKIMQGSC